MIREKCGRANEKAFESQTMPTASVCLYKKPDFNIMFAASQFSSINLANNLHKFFLIQS